MIFGTGLSFDVLATTDKKIVVIAHQLYFNALTDIGQMHTLMYTLPWWLTWHRPFPGGSSRTRVYLGSWGKPARCPQWAAGRLSSPPPTGHTARTERQVTLNFPTQNTQRMQQRAVTFISGPLTLKVKQPLYPSWKFCPSGITLFSRERFTERDAMAESNQQSSKERGYNKGWGQVEWLHLRINDIFTCFTSWFNVLLYSCCCNN